MSGSVMELKRMMHSAPGYERVRTLVAKKSWEFIGFDERSVTLRIEMENLKFDRKKGTILERFKL